MTDLEQFCKDRNEALLSLNADRIVAFCNKYGVPVPENELVFWAGVHKGIIALNAASERQKHESAAWLISHGFKA